MLPTALRNPFAFPFGVMPGVNLNHPAAGPRLRYSGVAAPGGGFVNLLTGGLAAKISAPTTLPSIIGPALNAQTTTGWVTDGTISETITADTMAVIVIPTTSVAVGRTFVKSNTNITVGIAGIVIVNLEVGYFTQGSYGGSGIVLSLNVPYFIALSVRNGNKNWVVVNLLTGQIRTSFQVGAVSMNNPSPPYAIGGNFSGARAAGALIAAAMFTANSYLKPELLLQWALDPWAFWYPQDIGEVDGVGRAAFLAAWARHSNSIIGGAQAA